MFDDWKKLYANNEVDVSYPYLWENFDANAYSIWWCEYKHPEDNPLQMNADNLVGGFFQRIEGLHKHAQSIMATYKRAEGGHAIKGAWIVRGTSLIFEVSSRPHLFSLIL